MRRRKFVGLLACAVTTVPVVVRAQQQRPRHIGIIWTLAEDDSEERGRLLAFRESMQQLGWVDGQNIRLDNRWNAGDLDSSRQAVTDLVQLSPDVVLATGTQVAAALQQATRTVPVVFVAVSDPVSAGLVASLAKPGGNITGFTNFEYDLGAKWLELLKEIAPDVTRVGVVRDPSVTASIGQFAAIKSVASSLGVEVSAVGGHDEVEIGRTVAPRM